MVSQKKKVDTIFMKFQNSQNESMAIEIKMVVASAGGWGREEDITNWRGMRN